jgi:hypothetical protein
MSQDDDGVRVVLSSVQLAAVLTQESISEAATLSNRLWGGLRIVGGVLELTGAGVLCVAPEPTMVSKVGCVVFGLHGSDTTATGARQVWTGRDSQSLTHMGTAALAKALGADPATADNIGLAVDIAVPLAMSAVVGAARVAAVRAGRISLIEHEAEAGSRIGGHTLEKHIGRTEAQLRERLAREPIIRTASTFSNLQMAETAISQVLRANAAKISNWAQIPGSKPLDLVQEIGTVVGYGVVRATGQVVKMTKVRVVLKLETFRGQPYYILTSYLLP